MKNKTMTTNIGTINLSEIEVTEDCLEIFIPIIAVSENLKAIIEENIQKAKAEFQREHLDKRGKKWSNSGIVMDFQSLYVMVEGKSFHYKLCFGFEDKEDKRLWTDFSLDVDLSEYEKELKKLILKATIDKFF